MRRGMVAAGAVAAALAAACSAASAQAPEPPHVKPTDPLQPMSDGCQRFAAGLLTWTSPEWVFVYGGQMRGAGSDPAPQVAEGPVRGAHVSGGDLPEGHDYYDLNADVAVQPDQQYLLTREDDPTAIHTEWESGTVPAWAWPTDGDTMKAWGSWIWDCGHWGPGFSPDEPAYFAPGDEGQDATGEGAELHPLRAMVVTRHSTYRSETGETEADAYIGDNGTFAHAEETCARQFGHDAPSGFQLGGHGERVLYDPGYTACVQALASHGQTVNDRDYSFFVPAPPKPSPNATLRYRVVDMKPAGTGPVEQVTPRADGIDVTVPFNGFGANGPLAFGKSFFVGWEGDAGSQPEHFALTVTRVTVHNAMDRKPTDVPDPSHPQSGVAPGEYGLYIDANGYWRYLNDWWPGLDQVNDGDTFTGAHTIDLYVPKDQAVHVSTNSRECDLPKINPCPNTAELAPDNDNPGDATNVFASGGDSVGTHLLSTPNYEIGYRVERVAGAAPVAGPPTSAGSGEPGPVGVGGPGSLGSPAGDSPNGGGLQVAPGCVDSHAPRSRFSKRGSRASRGGGLRLRGRTSDASCGSRAGRVMSISVAVARRQGSRCRFLDSKGAFGHPASCSSPAPFLAATGTPGWRFVLAHGLARGRYVAWARGVDSVGNVELPSSADRLRFRVR